MEIVMEYIELTMNAAYCLANWVLFIKESKKMKTLERKYETFVYNIINYLTHVKGFDPKEWRRKH